MFLLLFKLLFFLDICIFSEEKGNGFLSGENHDKMTKIKDDVKYGKTLLFKD